MSTIVYGSSLAALVTADQLTAAGEAVTLVSPTPHLGGHFAGSTVGGARFDAGLVVFEFDAVNAATCPDPITYRPDVHNDSGRFGNVLASYMASLGIALEPIPALRMYLAGALIPDFVLDTCLDGVRALPPWVRGHATAELQAILAAGEQPQHAGRMYLEPRYGCLTYEEASLANHGAALHLSCFEPFARKVTGHATRDLLALYARAAGLPLFSPESLADAFAGEEHRRPEPSFHVVRGGAVADAVHALVRRLEATPTLTRRVASARGVHAHQGGVRLVLDDEAITAQHLVWGHDLDTLATITGEAPAAPIVHAPVTIVLALVSRGDVVAPTFGSVILPDDHAMPYRITNQSTNAGMPDESLVRVSIEWGGADAPTDDDALLALTQAALARVGITSHDAGFVAHEIRRIPHALVVPSAENRDTILALRQRVEATGLPILTVAPAAGFAVASINDQLVQGMRAARRVMASNARAIPQADGADVTSAFAA